MARADEAEWVKVMKEAKTWEEKVISWGFKTPGRSMQPLLDALKLWGKKKPEMIDTFNRQYIDIIDRGILDKRSRELCLIAANMARQTEPTGIIAHWQNVTAAGTVTEEEIMEIAALAAYMVCRYAALTTATALAQALAGTRTTEKGMEPSAERFKLWLERKPEIIEAFNRQYREIVERGILDRRTIQLCLLTMAIGMLAKGYAKEGVDIVALCEDAKAVGITEEEIMEIAALQCYSPTKTNVLFNAGALSDAFKAAANVRPYKEKVRQP